MSKGKRGCWNLLGVALMLLLGACDFAPRSETAELRQKATALEAKLSEFETKLAELEAKVATQEFSAQLARDQFSNVTFDPGGDEGFSRLDTSVGSFAVSLQEVAPYADGVKVRFHVGNLGAATINGATFKVRWGSRMPEPGGEGLFNKYLEWKKTLSEKEAKVLKDLKPGTWNNVSLTLPGTKPADLGYLELSMETSQISLHVER